MPNENFVHEFREIRKLAGRSEASVVQATRAKVTDLLPDKNLHPYWLRPLHDRREEPPNDELLVWIIPKTLLGEGWVAKAFQRLNDIRSYPKSYGLEHSPESQTAGIESFNRIISSVFTGDKKSTSFLNVVDFLQDSYSYGV